MKDFMTLIDSNFNEENWKTNSSKGDEFIMMESKR